MKKQFAVLGIMAAFLLSGSVGFSADADVKNDTTVDQSKNPVTGTETTTTKTDKEAKDANGKYSAKTTKKHKKYKNGSEKTTVDAKTKSESKTE